MEAHKNAYLFPTVLRRYMRIEDASIEKGDSKMNNLRLSGGKKSEKLAKDQTKNEWMEHKNKNK